MTSAHVDDCERQIRQLVEFFRESIPVDRTAQLLSLCDAGELRIALENLCDNLFDLDVVVPCDTLTVIAALGASMKMSSSYWSTLKQSIV